jgi:glycosyltransferase involved in cell wall biosynthesis
VGKQISSLIILHVPSNSGYAISPLEKLFFEVATDLADGNSSLVHFAYPDLSLGHPKCLPDSFKNIISFDFNSFTPESLSTLTDYVKHNEIKIVLGFDIQPIHPIIKPLRKSGVQLLLAYWGAPISSLSPAWKLALKKAQMILTRFKLDCLIFESQAMANLALSGRGVLESMVEVIPLGVDIELYKPSNSDYAHSAFCIPKSKQIIIYAGHMEERKGVKTLIESAIELMYIRKRKDICFLILGNKGTESKVYEDMFESLDIGESIIFGGYRNDLEKIYPSCFCGVIPSSGWDSFPRTSIEMASCGIPVIASRLQGLPEAVIENVTGLLFEPLDYKGLADKIEYLMDNPQEAKNLGHNGRVRCVSELNIEQQRLNFLSVIKRRLMQIN